jgi:hypothetical protein
VGLELWKWQLLVLFVPTVGSRFTAKSFGMYPERKYTNEGEPGTGLQEGGKKRRENDEGG